MVATVRSEMHGSLWKMLISSASVGFEPCPPNPCRASSPHASVKGDHIGLLLNCGLLTKHTNDTGAYWFAVPHVGQVVKSLVRGRKVRLAGAVLACRRWCDKFRSLCCLSSFHSRPCLCVGRSGCASCYGWTAPLVAYALYRYNMAVVLSVADWLVMSHDPVSGAAQEILGLLSRKRYPEMFVRDLEARKLQYSILDGRFHTRDLVGSGAVLQLETTSGPLLRLNKKT